VRPLSGALGAEVAGIDLAGLDDAGFAALYDAFLTHHVVVLRDQSLDPDQQLAFARRFGEIHLHPYVEGLPGRPEVLEVLKTESDTRNFGGRWHSDQMYTSEPAKCTILYAREIPDVGGDTIFASLHLAYERLSPAMQRLLQGLRGHNIGDRADRYGGKSRRELYGATMSAMRVKEPGDVETNAYHPLVRTHPETGRKGLYLGSHTQEIEGFEVAETAGLLDYLRDHVVRPEHTCRVSWAVDTLVVWDNRSVLHLAVNDYPGKRRRMHRVTVRGDRPF
jgi:taurine dioxygenase